VRLQIILGHRKRERKERKNERKEKGTFTELLIEPLDEIVNV
jgi:hypothetical protein